MKSLFEVVGDIGSRHFTSLARLQLLAEVGRIGYEHALIAFRSEPEKQVNKQLAWYVEGQGDEFYDLYQMITVRCWATIEALVEDVAAAALANINWSSPPRKWPNALKADVVELLSKEGEDRAQFLLALLQNATKTPMESGVGGFEKLLEAVDLGGGIPAPIRAEIFRMCRYRNCIVHRDGRIDKQLAKDFPHMQHAIGAMLGVTAQDARKFLFSIFWYMSELHRRAATDPSQVDTEVHREQEKWLSEIINCTFAPDRMPFAKPSLSFARSLPFGTKLMAVGPPIVPTDAGASVTPSLPETSENDGKGAN